MTDMSNSMVYRRRAVLRLVGLLGGTALPLLVMGCTPEKPQFASIDLTGSDYPKDFSLVDHNGQLRTLQEFTGKIVVVFFGFTQCPDVCPTSMAELVEVKQLLGKDGSKIQAIFITVDPERDTPELLKAYMANFDPTFLALRPTLEQLPQVAKDFKIYYKKVADEKNRSYTMDHSAGSYIFDMQGRIRLYSRFGSGAPALASDIKLLVQSA